MYESPVTIIESAVQTIMEEREGAILAKIQSVFDVDVDKEELIRALRYDRQQYEKGYMDGKEAAAPEWIPVTERLPEEYATVLVYDGDSVEPGQFYGEAGFWTYDQYEADAFCGITHWMPLPEPPNMEVNKNDR